MNDSSRIAAGIASLNCPGTTGPEGSVLRSRKGFSLISEGDPNISGAKPKVSDFRFRFTACVHVLLHLLYKSCSGLSTSDAKLACCAVEVC